MKCFCLQDVLIHADKNMKEHPDKKLLESMLKAFSMFVIKIYYANNIRMVGFHTNRINCNEDVGCRFNNQIFSKIFPVFVKTFLIHYFGLS